jgi:uncharacterized protein YdiU (UPF0061 family)
VETPTMNSLQWDDRLLQSLPVDPDETNRTRTVIKAVCSRVEPTPVAAPILHAHSEDLARTMGIPETLVHTQAFADAMAGNSVVGGMKPYASCYGGHQFGNWAGQLGDGRAITLGELVNKAGERFEVQLKGAGPTPYSRYADGRAVLRSSIREFLCSEAMHHLGVPTTRALSLVGTGDLVERDMFYNGDSAYEQGAVVARVAPSFLRFGSYQIHASRNDMETLRALTSYTLDSFFPELGPLSKDSVLALLKNVAGRTAHLMAEWMRVGFVHGVMNTDNMSLLGLTIDYGPYGWIDNYDPEWTPNTTDAGTRRYRFGLQPQMGGWNFVRLAEALYPLVDDMDAIKETVETYEQAWTEESERMISTKLGLLSFKGEADQKLWIDLTALLQRAETDMTIFFRGLANVHAAAEDPFALIGDSFYADPPDTLRAAWRVWMVRYLARVGQDDRSAAERKAAMDKVNPWFVLRNYLAAEAIEMAEAGDLSRVHDLLRVSQDPYVEHSDCLHFGAKRPEWARTKPGCSTLSCSS